MSEAPRTDNVFPRNIRVIGFDFQKIEQDIEYARGISNEILEASGLSGAFQVVANSGDLEAQHGAPEDTLKAWLNALPDKFNVAALKDRGDLVKYVESLSCFVINMAECPGVDLNPETIVTYLEKSGLGNVTNTLGIAHCYSTLRIATTHNNLRFIPKNPNGAVS